MPKHIATTVLVVKETLLMDTGSNSNQLNNKSSTMQGMVT